MITLDAINTVSIFGPVSSGKSHLIWKLVEPVPRVLHVDTTMENDDPDWLHIWANPRQLCESLVSSPDTHKIAYHPRNLHVSFEWCSQAYWQLELPRWLVLDECHEYADHRYFDTLMRYARKRKLGVLCASQRIADVPKSLTANSRTIVLFFTHEYRDHVAIKDRFGIEVSESVKALRPLIYNDSTGQVIQTPEALVYARGRGITIHDLGNGGERKLSSIYDQTRQTEAGEESADEAETPEETIRSVDAAGNGNDQVPSGGDA